MKKIFNTNKTKNIARVLLLIWLLNLLQPIGVHALTSGPAQPETQTFQPVGTSDMVDLVTGDFKYNIPLLDIDGYPLNLNYQSGIGPDDEASWVGLGWNLNVGSINRQLRGIPDDLKGDLIKTEHYTKDKVTVGGRLTGKVELKGDIKGGGRGGVNGSLTFGVFSDNYTGLGAEIGANAGMSFSFINDGMLTAGLGIGVLSSTASGLDITPNVSMSIGANAKEKYLGNAGLSSSLGYNSRSGMKSLTLGGRLLTYNSPSPSISYNTEPIQPRVQIPYTTTYNSYSVDLGVAAPLTFFGGGLTGYRSVRRVTNRNMQNPEYGFLYAEIGKNKANAVHDFIREKENPIITELPNLAIPIHTPDIFTYNDQTGSGQFRLYRGGSGAFFDNKAIDESKVETFGVDVGWGLGAHYGVTKFDQYTANTTQKWTKDNDYLPKGDFQDRSASNPEKQHVFFKKPGEHNIEDSGMINKIGNTGLLNVLTADQTASSNFLSHTELGNNIIPVSKIEKAKRQEMSTSISYLTAQESLKAGLETDINIYQFNNFGNFYPNLNEIPTALPRVNDMRQPHHISEITVLNENGQRSVYGLPVYSRTQEEISFAVDNSSGTTNGRVNIATNAQGGIINQIKDTDEYFHRDKQPSYANSFLLTGILSPDYIDRKGDGITKDDNGTAIKFKYSRIDNYRWRTPYNLGGLPQATLNRGLLADPKDDKGSIVYGEKEIYYVHSIESKTKIAFFITEDRDDGLGVLDFMGTKDPSIRQKRLKEIRLYSKDNFNKPIKIVKFDYDYSLCPGIPNSVNNGGKLTLTKVWFEYGLTHKGINHPYAFKYNSNAGYAVQMTDRWGTYKSSQNNPGPMTNDEFPYSDQDRSRADQAISLWHLSSIELPSGGKIDVKYEADDYKYVQDKNASVMVPFTFSEGNITSQSVKIRVPIDASPPSGTDPLIWFKRECLNGSDYIYTKSTVKISTNNAPSMGCDNDFVSVYAKVAGVSVSGNFPNFYADVLLDQVKTDGITTNPIRFAAWQKLKNEYPRYAYPGYENRIKDGNSSFQSAISAISNAARNLNEFKENFYQKAENRNFCNFFDPAKSFCRVAMISRSKIGGGLRVKQIRISDQWNTMGGLGAQSNIYGQDYDYTKLDENGIKVSSGVATYEPSVGSDENSLRQPVNYSQKVKGGITNYFELETPFMESLYPAPTVGYSKVTVKDYDPFSLSGSIPKTGFIVHEFYTAKDFPVRVGVTPIAKYNPRPSKEYSLIKTNSIEKLVLSQGYSIELNDMHGKPKSQQIYNSGSGLVSSTDYQYQVENPNAKSLKLNNKVNVIVGADSVKSAIIGRDIEFFTDFREQESVNSGTTNNLGVDLIPFLGAPIIPIPHFPININNEYKLFRSACAVKVIQTNGIIKKVVKWENGSSISVENEVFDGITGEAIITKTQNEFKKDYYTINFPAYWPYKKMGGAYQNQGMILDNVVLNNLFEINNDYWELLTQGDELLNLGTGKHYWVVDNRTSIPLNGIFYPEFTTEATKILVDENGSRLSSIGGDPINHSFKVVRSGYRNLLSSSAQSIVCMNNPVLANKILFGQNADLKQLKILKASAMTYDDEWPVDGRGQVTERKENSQTKFTYRLSQPHSVHGSLNCRFYVENFDETYQGDEWDEFDNSYLRNRQNSIGIWPDTGIPESLDKPLGFKTTVYVDKTDDYYVGFAGDDRLNIKIDDINFVDNSLNNTDYWSIRRKYLTEGYHTIEIEGFNVPNCCPTWADNPGTMGVEIYKNTEYQLRTATSASSLNTIFSTGNLLGNQLDFQTFRTINYVKTWRFTYESYFNPFLQGMKGNWRPYQQLIYQTNRSYDDILTPGKNGIDVANAGFLKFFTSYWFIQGNTWRANLQAENWVEASKVKLYDKYGQELENVDGLNRSSAASFDFNGQYPAAVSSNALRREIYTNSFEDISRLQGTPDTSATKEFVLANNGELQGQRNRKYAHTGNYSILLPSGGIKLETIKHSQLQKSLPYLGKTTKGEFSLLANRGLYPRGFEPKPGSEYLLTMWVNDKQPLNRDINVTVTRGNTNDYLVIQMDCKAVVEGWKLLEGKFTVPSNSNSRFDVIIVPKNVSELYLDDIRIHPKDSHLKSYAYDDRNYRLMAELDENAFATFYEYDDEGSLVRIKKETERGIATIRENHSSYAKKQ